MRNTGMSRLETKANWNEIKGRLRQKYTELTDDDLTFGYRKKDAMPGRLHRLGKEQFAAGLKNPNPACVPSPMPQMQRKKRPVRPRQTQPRQPGIEAKNEAPARGMGEDSAERTEAGRAGCRNLRR